MWYKAPLVILLIIAGPYSHSQQFNFRNISTSQGLPSNSCYGIMQDNEGYIWISTDAGLSKYNGKEFKTFTTANGLTDNTIFNTYQDEFGRIFYSSGNARIGYVYKDSCYILPVTDELEKEMQSGKFFILSISNFNTEKLLLSTKKGFYTLDKKTLSDLQRLTGPYQNQFCIKIIDGKAHSAFYPLSNSNDHVIYNTLQIENGTQKLNISIQLSDSGSTSVFKSLLLKDGRILAGFYNKVLIIDKHGDVKTINLSSLLHFLYQDKQGGVWISTLKNGLLYYPNARFEYAPIYMAKNITPMAIFMDEESGLWVSTAENGLFYCPSLAIVNYAEENGLNKKLYFLNRISEFLLLGGADEKMYSFRNRFEKKEIALSEKSFTHGCLSISQINNKIMTTGYNGIHELDDNYQSVDVFRQANEKLPRLYYAISGYQDLIYAIGIEQMVVLRNFQLLRSYDLPARGKDIAVDSNGRVFIATNKGLYKLKDKRIVPIRELNCRINRIKFDHYENLWVCTDGKGLIKIMNEHSFTVFNTKDGLASDICYDITFDKNNEAWIATNKGLSHIKVDNLIETYTTNHGLIDNEILQLEENYNELYVNTPKGLCVIDINSISLNWQPPPIFIKGVFNNNKNIISANVFASDQNNLRFDVEGISYQNEQAIKYKYRLLGLSEEWLVSNSDQINFNNLGNGNYIFQVLAINADGITSRMPATYSFTIKPPFWLNTWFLGLVILFTSGIIYAFVLWRIKIIRKKEAEKTAINKMIAESQLSALRAQMNPHFIFNAINSIQHFILNNESQIAYDYLAKFSKLIRLVLSNSKYNSISLKKELEMLELYIELEQRRFKNKFESTVIISDQIDQEEIKIPVMLLQPFVENAIWHGIMHLDESRHGKLMIEFILVDNDLLKITIEDNGIGRKKSWELKKDANHQSFGIKLAEERLRVLNKDLTKNGKIVIHDLYNEMNIATGTRVEIYINLLVSNQNIAP